MCYLQVLTHEATVCYFYFSILCFLAIALCYWQKLTGLLSHTQGSYTAVSGFFMPAYTVVSGMRGLKNGAHRNKRVVSLRTIRVPGVLPILEISRVKFMNLKRIALCKEGCYEPCA